MVVDIIGRIVCTLTSPHPCLAPAHNSPRSKLRAALTAWAAQLRSEECQSANQRTERGHMISPWPIAGHGCLRGCWLVDQLQLVTITPTCQLYCIALYCIVSHCIAFWYFSDTQSPSLPPMCWEGRPAVTLGSFRYYEDWKEKILLEILLNSL